MSHAAALAQLSAEHDAALEDVEFLQEQLRSATAYHAHLLDNERVRLLTEHRALLRELTILDDELKRARDEVSPAVTCHAGDDD